MILDFLTWTAAILALLIVAGWIVEGPVGEWLIEFNRRLHK